MLPAARPPELPPLTLSVCCPGAAKPQRSQLCFLPVLSPAHLKPFSLCTPIPGVCNSHPLQLKCSGASLPSEPRTVQTAWILRAGDFLLLFIIFNFDLPRCCSLGSPSCADQSNQWRGQNRAPQSEKQQSERVERTLREVNEDWK